MRYLLDTNVFLFWNSNSPKLSDRARSTIASPRAELLLSAASSWEIAIKCGLGKLKLPDEPWRYVPERMRDHRIVPLSIEHADALEAGQLPAVHDDPFDRILIAQAQRRRLRVVTADPRFREYGIEVVW